MPEMLNSNNSHLDQSLSPVFTGASVEVKAELDTNNHNLCRCSCLSKFKKQKHRRKQRAGSDLVGVESNPGPRRRAARVKISVQPAATSSAVVQQQRKKKRKRAGRRAGPIASNDVGSQYLKSLMYPPTTLARIPDSCAERTCLVQMSTDQTFSTSASTLCGGFRVQLSNVPGGLFCANETSASTDSAFAYAAGFNIAGSAAFSSLYAAARLVSASLEVEFTGSDQYNGGEIFLAHTYANQSFAELPPSSVTSISATHESRIAPLKTIGKWMIRYKPLDSTATAFQSTASLNSLGYLIVHANGSTVANPANFRVRVVANYEAIPSVDTTSLVQADDSPVNVSAYNAVTQIFSKQPAIVHFGVNTPEYAGDSMAADYTQRYTSFPAIFNSLAAGTAGVYAVYNKMRARPLLPHPNQRMLM